MIAARLRRVLLVLAILIILISPAIPDILIAAGVR